MRIVLTTWFTCLALAAPALAQISADDFLPPVQGGPREISQPARVEVRADAVVAATAQDAINAAVEENKKAKKGTEEGVVGVRLVQFPSGLGYVATGQAVYRVLENPVATRIAKRKAYVIAYTQAKKGLAETLGGLSNQGKETIRQALINVNLPKEEMTNLATVSEEAITQAVDMFLRGFEVYEVHDDPKRNLVTVSIVTTPRTRARVARPAGHAVEVKDIREGLNQVIREVRTSVVPPVGSRIIVLRGNGEIAFVGFGSIAVRSSANAAVQAKLNLEAQKIAAMHAKDALCGLLCGDRTVWQGRVVESLQDAVQEFEVLQAGDPLARQNPAGVQKLEKARQTFVARLQTEELLVSVRKGILPPGVTTKTWFDEGHEWAFAMSVYLPSAGKTAEDAAKEFQDQGIGNSGFKDERNPDVKRPGDVVKPGPSGKVGNDKDR